MRTKFLAALVLVVASCQPMMAGDLLENLKYSLPNVENPRVVVVCRTKSAMINMLDNLENYKLVYNTTRVSPPDCIVNLQGMVIDADHWIESLLISDEGKLYGLIEIDTISQGASENIWTYIDEQFMVKKDGGDT